jgi:cold shock CspA family protein
MEGAPAEKEAIPRTEGEVITGKCKVWNVDKGYGFFECADGGEDIFMHQSAVTVAEAKFRAILPGTELNITYSLRDGKATCSNIVCADGSPLPGFESKLIATQLISRASAEPGTKFGKCKWFNADKGFGFIIPDDGTTDVFVNIKDVEGNQPLAQDDPVQFAMAKQADNRDRAVKVKNLKAPQAAPQFFPMQPPAYNPYGQAVQPYYPPTPSPYGVQAGAGGSLTGTIKWYNEERGFGFIIPSNGSVEVYFRGNAIQGGAQLTEGDPVEFEEKSADGKVWACSVVSLKSRKRKNPMDGYGSYDPNPMFKAPRQAYAPAQAQPPAQYDPYGNPVPGGQAPPAAAQQYAGYEYPPAGRQPQNGAYGAEPGYGYGAQPQYY